MPEHTFHHGLVVGKFAPLHLGHESLIRHAIARCRRVSIISYSQPELPGYEPYKRERWLQARFPGTNIRVLSQPLLDKWRTEDWQHVMPANTASDACQQAFMAALLDFTGLHDIDAVFSNESYGRSFAAHLSGFFSAKFHASRPVDSISLDPERARFPVSGTALREDIHQLKQWVAPEVYAHFVERVAILGGESAGKSTLAAGLAKQYNTQWVPEFGRYWWLRKQGSLTRDDFLHIARHQIYMEDVIAGQANRWLFCDTSPLATLFYYQHQFGELHPELLSSALRPYRLRLLLKNDFPHCQDGTRQSPAFSFEQYRWYQRFLDRHSLPYRVIEGSPTARVQQVERMLEASS